MRLAHFNVLGHDEGGAYSGLSIDSNIIVVTALFPLRELDGLSQQSSLLGMDQSVLELVHAADVVEMKVCCHGA